MHSIKSYENHKLMCGQYFFLKVILKELFKFTTHWNIKIYNRYKKYSYEIHQN
jgi:hypothetical protein